MDRDEKYVNRWVWEKKRNGTGVRKRVLKGATKQYFLLSTRKEVVNLSMNGNLNVFYYTWQDHGRSQRSSKSSSPDTKRQKLDEGKESNSNSEETTKNNLQTTAESCSKTNTDVIVINAEESCHEQAASEMQPMTVDEDMLEKQTQQQQADSDVGRWSTICGLQ